MFAKSVQEYRAPAPARTTKKPPTLSQQLFPSSSPSAPVPAGRKSSTLAPNPSAANVQLGGGSNPLKRSATDACLPVTRMQNGSKITISHPTHSSGPGLVGMLHNSVSFDENDFVDDADLDLDADDDIIPAPKRPCTIPTANAGSMSMRAPLAAAQPPPPSSQPIPWSSSPLHHKLPPPETSVSHNSVVQDKADVVYPKLPGADAETPAKKRRKLPWVAEEEAKKAKALEKVEKPKKGHPSGMSAAMASANAKASATPAKAGPKAPWNMSASAMKAEQQKFRQKANQSKKIKDLDPDDAASVKGRKSNRKGAKPITLSEEQSKVLALVTEAKKSVFFTGSAGTGKSVLMREIISAMRNKFAKEADRVAVTASTGLAACNIGGVTLHSFGGIGLGKEPAEQLVKKIKKNAKAKNRWLRTKVLIVDEISMVDGELFDKLEKVARMVRTNARPFGGIQLVVTGDFFQLPPVPDPGKVAKFAFEAGTWSTSIEHTIGLTQIFRQRDPEFASMLNEMRVGRLSQESIRVFHSLSRPLANIKGDDVEVQATELFPTRNEVDNANGMRLHNIRGDGTTYDALDGGAITDPAFRDKLLSNCIAPPRITLKKGAQVMLIKNIDESLVNGSIGQVIGFMDEKQFDSTHSAGAEIPGSSTSSYRGGGGGGGGSSWSDDEDFGGRGGDSASISRAKLREMVHQQDPRSAVSTAPKWPVVRFPLPTGGHRDLLCQRESWKIELPNGEVQASRLQVPLILAWALSIHKAQGQTLESVKVDLGKIFEKGQAYVALSRATTQEGLQVLRFDPRKVMAHDRVRAFYDSLYNVDKAAGRAEGASSKGLQKKIGLDRVAYPDLDDYDYGGEDDAWMEVSRRVS